MTLSSEGEVLPGGPAVAAGPPLPMDERTTDLAAWRAANEAKSARQRGFLSVQIAERRPARTAPVAAEPEVDESAYPEYAVPLERLPDDTAAAAAPPPEKRHAAPATAAITGPPEAVKPQVVRASTPAAREAPRRARGSRLDVTAVCNAYVAGKSIPQIAEKYGSTPATVRRALREAGARLRDDRGGGRHVGRGRVDLDPEQTRSVVDKYNAGASIDDLAKDTGRHVRVVRRVLVEQGVTIRPPAHIAAKAASVAPSEQVPELAQPQATASTEPPPVDLAAELTALADDLAGIVARLRALLAGEGATS